MIVINLYKVCSYQSILVIRDVLMHDSVLRQLYPAFLVILTFGGTNY